MIYSAIAFPGLGLEIDPIQTLELGPLSIHIYGVVIALALMMAVLYGCARSRELDRKSVV